jgi:hypothetical protein
MRLLAGRRIGLRTALVAIVLGGILLSAAVLHLTWWGTATSVSRNLVDVLETEITEAVRREWWGVVGEVERLSQAMRDLLDGDLPPELAGDVLVAVSRPSDALSWLLLVPPAGEIAAVESLPGGALRLLQADEAGGVRVQATVSRPRTRRRYRTGCGRAASPGLRKRRHPGTPCGSMWRRHRTGPGMPWPSSARRATACSPP